MLILIVYILFCWCCSAIPAVGGLVNAFSAVRCFNAYPASGVLVHTFLDVGGVPLVCAFPAVGGLV